MIAEAYHGTDVGLQADLQPLPESHPETEVEFEADPYCHTSTQNKDVNTDVHVAKVGTVTNITLVEILCKYL